MTHIRTLGLVAGAALLMAAPAQAQRQVSARHDASATGTVEISINAGSLRVTGWGRNEVQVTGTVAREGDQLQLDGGGRMVEVRVEGRRGTRAGAAHLEVRVPAGSRVEVSAASAPITINGVNGHVEANSQNGGVTVQGSPRAIEIISHSGAVVVGGQTDVLDVTSMSGPVRVSGNVRQRADIEALSGPVDLLGTVGEAHVSAMSGPVRVSNATGRVEIEAVSGGVTLNGTRLRGSVQSVSGRVVVSGSLGGTLDLESHSGGVELRLPRNASAEVEVSTFNGALNSDFGNGTGGRRERHVTIGRGGPAVSITTFSGDVKLARQ